MAILDQSAACLGNTSKKMVFKNNRSHV